MSDVQTRLLRVVWAERLMTGPNGAPVLPPEFVADQGRLVRLLDLRSPDGFVGPVGHVPGASRLDLAAVGELVALGVDTPVVLACDDGSLSAPAAVYLRALGMRYVAALDGGVRAWRSRGFATSRADDAVALDAPRGAELAAVDADAVLAHLGDPGAVRWVKLAGLMLHGKRSCVDGRDDHGVLGAPGGDAGEFLLALAALEAHTGRPLDVSAVHDTLVAFVDTFGRFYMHSDIQTWNVVIKAFRADPRLVGLLPVEGTATEWRAFLRQPPAAAREAVLDHLVRPAHVGCGHLRLSATRSDAYGVRPELVRWFMEAFWTAVWAGYAEFEHVTLGGAHAEQAVLSVRLDDPVWPFTEVPLIRPTVGERQVFVYHPQVAQYLRVQTARFLSRRGFVAEAEVAALAERMDALGAQQLGATLGALAHGLPVFDVVFARDRTVRVHALGPVS